MINEMIWGVGDMYCISESTLMRSFSDVKMLLILTTNLKIAVVASILSYVDVQHFDDGNTFYKHQYKNYH